jgi:thiosulfate dehydrogenase
MENLPVAPGTVDTVCSSRHYFLDSSHHTSLTMAVLKATSIIICLELLSFSSGFPQTVSKERGNDSLAYGVLIPASASMARAWEIPRDPYRDSVTVDASRRLSIQNGFSLFTKTAQVLPYAACNTLTCSNCHLNAGQRERALPLVGIAVKYPEYNKRAGRDFTLEDRIIECLRRSIDAHPGGDTAVQLPSARAQITPTSNEVADLAAYLLWLSSGYTKGQKVPWRGKNTIDSVNLLPIHQLDTAAGRRSFTEKCITCHGMDGQGVQIGDKIAGPLWGDKSWNDGAGASRVYTLAGMIRYTMPYLDPGSLTDREAQEIAAFINSQKRPLYHFKSLDYPGLHPPPDAVYYRPTTHK